MKKLISIILTVSVLFAVFALASCGDNSSGGGSSSTTTTTTGQSGGEKPTYEPMNFYEMDISSYITLGKYKNFTI